MRVLIKKSAQRYVRTGTKQREAGLFLLRAPRGAPLRLGVLVAALATMMLLSAAFAAGRAASATFYCNQYVGSYRNCPQHYNGYFNFNESYVPHANFGDVCENATITYRAGNVSKRCSNTADATSGCDLFYYYSNNYELSIYAGNNQNLDQYIVGKGDVLGGCA